MNSCLDKPVLHEQLSYSNSGLNGQATPQKPADVYSFGVLISEVLTGASPFPHLSNDVQVGQAVDSGERPALPAPSSDPTMSSMVDLIERMWDEHPSKRPEAASVCEELVRAAALAEAHRIEAANKAKAEKEAADRAKAEMEVTRVGPDQQSLNPNSRRDSTTAETCFSKGLGN